MPELQYAIDRNGKMVHIDTVPNGLACHCTCPGCGAYYPKRNYIILRHETIIAKLDTIISSLDMIVSCRDFIIHNTQEMQ